MSGTIANRDAWHPETREDREAVLRELQQILASPHFCNSKRYPALLQYIVENTLAGKSDLLKERTLGIEVFDRPPTFDTNTDTVVRYTAGEVRKRLQLYYHEHGQHASIRISLPVGTYIPEFVHWHDRPDEFGDHAGHAEHLPDADVSLETDDGVHERWATVLASPEKHTSPPIRAETGSSRLPQPRSKGVLRLPLWLGLAAVGGAAFLAGLNWRSHTVPAHTPVDAFWAPIVKDQHMVLVCTGGVVFAQGNFSGVVTASKDVDYPFVSMQNASAIADISEILERSGAVTQLVFAGSEPLTQLRENSVVLLGGYNNDWTLRLLQPLRFHFTPEPVESIVDQQHPQVHWARDRSLPYSSADDYALIARFRDSTTDGWVVVMAGLGRNGTEAAAQFAISPHYMQLLRDQIGRDFSNQNLEAVIKVKVIDGKTGAPSILAVHTW